MGNNCQCSGNKAFYDLNAWQIISSHNNYQLIRSIHDESTVLQKWESSSLENHFEYQVRKEMKQNCFLKIHHYGIINNNNISLKQHSFVITDKLQNLSTVKGLTYFQCMFILKQVIYGIKILVEKYGQFQIVQDMIWVDQYGKPKVWINVNAAKNRPSFSIKNKLNNFQEYIIKKVINIVAKCAIDTEKINFSSTIKTFFKAVEYFQKQMNSGIFPVQKINLKKPINSFQNINLKRNSFQQYKETSIVLPVKTLKSSLNLPQMKNIPSVSSLQCSVRDSYQQYLPSKFPTKSTLHSRSTKNSQYISGMERSNHSSQNQIFNKKYDTQNNLYFGQKIVNERVSLSKQNINPNINTNTNGNEYRPFKAIQGQSKQKKLKESLDPDKLLDQLMKSQNIKFQ